MCDLWRLPPIRVNINSHSFWSVLFLFLTSSSSLSFTTFKAKQSKAKVSFSMDLDEQIKCLCEFYDNLKLQSVQSEGNAFFIVDLKNSKRTKFLEMLHTSSRISFKLDVRVKNHFVWGNVAHVSFPQLLLLTSPWPMANRKTTEKKQLGRKAKQFTKWKTPINFINL